MATPHVTGTVALLAAYNPSLTPAQIRERIIRTAVPVLSTASKTVASGRANAFNALTNTVVPAGSPAIRAVRTNKKFVFVDGLNFASGSSVIEVNGVPLRKNKFDDIFLVANGTRTQVKAKLGKAGVQSTFSLFTQVSVTVFNQATNERSAPINFTRF
jgi:subtilisin family serine protease